MNRSIGLCIYLCLSLVIACFLSVLPSFSSRVVADHEYDWVQVTPVVTVAPLVGPKIPKPKPRSKPKLPITYTYSGNWFVIGNCTWHVASKMKIDFHGDAKYWLTNAEAAGYIVSQIPLKGAAVQLRSTNRSGHVAYVEAVDAVTITISAMNEEGKGVITVRTLPIHSPDILGYIYPKYK